MVKMRPPENRLVIDDQWKADVAALVTPENETQRTALHYAAVVGAVPVRVPARSKRTHERGWTGYVRLPEADMMASAIMRFVDGDNLGLRLPANVIAIDVDGGYLDPLGHLKKGGEALSRLETEFGPLAPTFYSTRRPTDPDHRPENTTGHFYYQLPEQMTRYYVLSKDRPPVFVQKIALHIDVIQFSHRYSVVAPSTVPDDTTGAALAYQFYAPDHTPISPYELPPFSELPTLPQRWARKFRTERTKPRLRPAPRPGETYQGATHQESADAANQWCADNVPGWDEPIDSYLEDLAERYIADLRAERGSRHDTALTGTLAVLLAAVGNDEWPTHDGANQAIQAIGDAFLRATNGDRQSDLNRQFVGAVHRLTEAIENGDITPQERITYRFTREEG